jgi:hypothetical protein
MDFFDFSPGGGFAAGAFGGERFGVIGGAANERERDLHGGRRGWGESRSWPELHPRRGEHAHQARGGQRRLPTKKDETSSLPLPVAGGLPGPSFFSNFQMPFLLSEEITIKDRNASTPDFFSDDDENGGGEDTILSSFGNFTAVVSGDLATGASVGTNFLDDFTRLTDQQPFINGSDMQVRIFLYHPQSNVVN